MLTSPTLNRSFSASNIFVRFSPNLIYYVSASKCAAFYSVRLTHCTDDKDWVSEPPIFAKLNLFFAPVFIWSPETSSACVGKCAQKVWTLFWRSQFWAEKPNGMNSKWWIWMIFEPHLSYSGCSSDGLWEARSPSSERVIECSWAFWIALYLCYRLRCNL